MTDRVLDDLAELIAVRWPRYGNPVEDYLGAALIAAEFLGLPPPRDWDAQHAALQDLRALNPALLPSAVEDLTEHRLLPPRPRGTLRVNHNYGFDLGGDYFAHARERLTEQLLQEGLVPQPTTAGYGSESPHEVFAVVDQPAGNGVLRRHNPHYPWLTFDVPVTGANGSAGAVRSAVDRQPSADRTLRGASAPLREPWSTSYRADERPGTVVTFNHLPASMIVGVNGLPVARFRAALRHWGFGS